MEGVTDPGTTRPHSIAQSDMSSVDGDVSELTQVETTSDYYVSMAADINTAAALRAQYAIETPKPTRRRRKKGEFIDEAEPLVDTTKTIPLHSKKTERLQKRQKKKIQRAANQPSVTTIFNLPSELLTEILSLLRPSDVFCLMRSCHHLRDVVLNHENAIAREIIHRRYWTIRRCFQTPVAFKDVPEDAHAALLSSKRQEMLNIHRKSYYQHVEMINPHEVCTCMACVFAWNNLCLILDLNHWQQNLEHREPIPMIPRGSNPDWNRDMLSRNADIVRQSMRRPLVYARIMEKHLTTITSTLSRMSRVRYKNPERQETPPPYQMTSSDVATGTDAFLDRHGPPSYDFPYHRDVYYNLDVYLPNRKWSKETRRWHYYPPDQHERDLEWVRNAMRRWGAVGNELLRQTRGQVEAQAQTQVQA